MITLKEMRARGVMVSFIVNKMHFTKKTFYNNIKKGFNPADATMIESITNGIIQKEELTVISTVTPNNKVMI